MIDFPSASRLKIVFKFKINKYNLTFSSSVPFRGEVFQPGQRVSHKDIKFSGLTSLDMANHNFLFCPEGVKTGLNWLNTERGL